MPARKYILTLKNDLDDLEKLRSFVEDIRDTLSVSKKCQFETNLALEEVFTNILSYGFNRHSDHFIKITITTAQGVLTIRVEDDGKPFNPLETKEPTLQYDIENCAPGGLGIHLIKHFTDDIRYKRYQNRNVLTMKKEGCFHEGSTFQNPPSCASRFC
jgi:serine/threonine-protein kinase RsbW